MVPTAGISNEAHKKEPDKVTYLVFRGSLAGADPQYWYGTRFLFQGHEGGNPGYLKRINLDADAAHRVTLLATQHATGSPLATIDGSTWDPWARRLLLTTENAAAPTYAATPGDLANGRLQVLQVLNAGGAPITQASQTALNSPDQLALHVYGSSFRTRWITIHDTAVDGTAAFNANLLAKGNDGTPFKRPENAVFRPGTHFRDLYFDETGDTNATSPENADAGGSGSLFRLTQKDPSADSGRLSIFYEGVQAHAGFDNLQFLSRDTLCVVEDAGDTLHTQRNALDSGYALEIDRNYSNAANQPLRWLAEGRDASAAIDSAFGGFGKNDGENELTGVYVSDGDPSARGVLGAKTPKLWQGGWRWFYTQQHGDNPTYELVPSG